MLNRAHQVMAWPLGQTLARRIIVMALVLCAAGVPLLPLNEMKVAGTFLAGLVLGVGLYMSLRSGGRVERTPLDAPAITFLSVAVLATIFSVNPRVSFFPNITRGEGLLDYFVYVPAALAAARMSRLEAREVLAVLLGAGALVGAIAVGQFYGIDATTWIGSRYLNYGFHSWGTLANPDFLGGYAALVMPIGIAMAAGAVESPQWLGYGAASALLYAALLGSETRSAWVGAALAGIIILRGLPPAARTYRRLALLGLVFAAITAAMMLTRPQVSLSGRAASALNPADQSMEGRLWIWEHSVPMIRERPVLGWGFSAILGHLPGIGTPSYVRVFGTGRLFIDAAHNDLLQTAIDVGLTGLAAYLWIWATAAGAIYRAARAPASPPTGTSGRYAPASPPTGTSRRYAPASPVQAEAVGILAAFVAYFVWLQFLWRHIGNANVFWVLSGIAVSLARTASPGAADTDGIR